MKNLAEVVRQGVILLDSDSHEMDDVLLDVVEQCVKQELVPASLQERVLEQLRNREALDSTAIGHGVAIPHAYVEGDLHSVVAFVRLKHPIDVRAIDDEPARFLFILIGHTGQVDDHLDMLASIAVAISDNELRFDLLEAETENQIVQAFDRFMQSQRSGIESTAGEFSDELNYTGRPFGGIILDVRRRLPHLASDLTDGLHLKSLTAIVFLYFACLAPAVLFGGLMYEATGGHIGAAEMLVATAGCGIVFALFAGQPLIILGGTGPLLIFTGILYQLCQKLQINFLQTYAWVGLWTAAFTALLGATDASCLIRFFTRFTDEIFAALISLIFIVEAVSRIVGYVNDAHAEELAHDVAFLSLIMAMGTFITAMMLSRFRKSRYLVPQIREFLSDFGPTMAVALMLLFGMLFPDVKPSALKVPDTFGTSSGRPWAISIFDAPIWVWFGAIGPAVLATVLVYLDQNITARLVNSHDHRLQKGSGYHLDLTVVGVLIGCCSIIGLPWLVAATVRSLNHVRALATVEDRITPGGDRRDEIVHVRENRITGFMVHLLIGISLLMLSQLQSVPEAALYGLFLYMGIVSIVGNQLFERAGLWIMDPALYPRTHYTRKVPMQTIHQFTLLQVSCLIVLWIVKVSAAAILFPLFIALLVPGRLLASRFFAAEHLEALDAEQLPEEEESEWI